MQRFKRSKLDFHPKRKHIKVKSVAERAKEKNQQELEYKFKYLRRWGEFKNLCQNKMSAFVNKLWFAITATSYFTLVDI